MQHVGSQFPKQGSNPRPLHWQCRVLTTIPPGKQVAPKSSPALHGWGSLSTIPWRSFLYEQASPTLTHPTLNLIDPIHHPTNPNVSHLISTKTTWQWRMLASWGKDKPTLSTKVSTSTFQGRKANGTISPRRPSLPTPPPPPTQVSLSRVQASLGSFNFFFKDWFWCGLCLKSLLNLT